MKAFIYGIGQLFLVIIAMVVVGLLGWIGDDPDQVFFTMVVGLIIYNQAKIITMMEARNDT